MSSAIEVITISGGIFFTVAVIILSLGNLLWNLNAGPLAWWTDRTRGRK